MEKMNFDVLRRKRAFYTGIDIQLKPEFGETKELLGWAQMPDVLPIRPKTGYVQTDYKTLLANKKVWEPAQGTPGGEALPERVVRHLHPADGRQPARLRPLHRLDPHPGPRL